MQIHSFTVIWLYRYTVKWSVLQFDICIVIQFYRCTHLDEELAVRLPVVEQLLGHARARGGQVLGDVPLQLQLVRVVPVWVWEA